MQGYQRYQSCIDACLRCAAACNNCAGACTREPDVHMMARCIQLDMECAAVCYASSQLMSLGSEWAKDLCATCARICEACGDECEKHTADHCRQCARMCRACAGECRSMAA